MYFPNGQVGEWKNPQSASVDYAANAMRYSRFATDNHKFKLKKNKRYIIIKVMYLFGPSIKSNYGFTYNSQYYAFV